MALPERVLYHGVEGHFFTNHVGHFILVNGLMDRLTVNGRVVTVSSGAHMYAKGPGIVLDDLSWDRPYKPWSAYGQSKLANILFAKELARRLPEGQTANALHPGVIETELWRHLPADYFRQMSASTKTIEQGAATNVFLAAHPSVSQLSGEYFVNCAVANPSKQARDEKLSARLWEATELLVARLN